MVHRSDQRALLTLKVTINPILWSKFQFFIGKKLGLSNNIKGNPIVLCLTNLSLESTVSSMSNCMTM